jgi:hypothetical protein
MGIISVRLNAQEEKVIRKLVEYYDEDRSKLLKRSLIELYENIVDGYVIEKYERKESAKKMKFHSAEEILKAI